MNKECLVVFWDVQHGHATYIKTPNGRHIVIDLGTGDYSGKNLEFSPLLHLKNNYLVPQIDFLIITHPHLDHIDDIINFDLLFPKILERPQQLTNEEIMNGVLAKDRRKFEKYCEINNIYRYPVIKGSINDHTIPEHWGGLKIQTFIPIQCNHSNFNNHSIVTIIEFANIKIVIPGDNEQCSFDELLLMEGFISAITDSDILLAPHHGRESGFHQDFINYVNPRLTVVSDGSICDTSANSRYSIKSQGWIVFNKNGQSNLRKCLTTNSDGEVTVRFGYDSNETRFLNVQIE